MKPTIHIDDEFKNLMPTLDNRAFDQLCTSIREEGCREPLIVWEYEGKQILLDGHNRYMIFTANEVPFTVSVKTIEQLPDRAAAIAWIIRNQLARRNLSPEQFSLYLGKLYNSQKPQQGGTGANQYRAQTDHNDLSAQQLAKQQGVSAITVKRAGQFAEAVEKAKESDPDIEQKVLAGEVTRKQVMGKAEPATVEGHELVKDADGRAIPEHLTAVFAAREQFERFAQTLSTLKGQVRQAIEANSAAWDRFRENESRRLMQRAHDLLKLSGPFIVCSYCGADHSENCRACKGTGWLNRAQARCVPGEMRP